MLNRDQSMCKKTRFTSIAVLSLASVIGLTPYDVSAQPGPSEAKPTADGCKVGFYARLLSDQNQDSVDACKKRHEEFLSEIRAHAKSEVCTSTCQSQTKDGVASVPCDSMLKRGPGTDPLPLNVPNVASLPWDKITADPDPESLVKFISVAQGQFPNVKRSFIYVCDVSKKDRIDNVYYVYLNSKIYSVYDFQANSVGSYFEIDAKNSKAPKDPDKFQTLRITGDHIQKNTIIHFSGPKLDDSIRIHANSNLAKPLSQFESGFYVQAITPFGGTRRLIDKINDGVKFDRHQSLSYLWTVLPTVLGIPSLVLGSVLLQQDGQCLTAQNYSCAGKVHQLDLAIPLFVVGLAHVVVPSIVRQIKVIGYLDRVRTVP